MQIGLNIESADVPSSDEMRGAIFGTRAEEH